MIRIFHPVGQGAFYTEQHLIAGKIFSIVYDCGSLTLKEEERKKMIEGFFPKSTEIDILFISHFDADHINAIKALKDHCEIKRVIIPLLKAETKICLKLQNFIEYGFDEGQIIDDPVSFFSGSKVTMVEEVSLEDDFDSSEEITFDELTPQIKSGKSIKLDKNDNWFYIPYNYKYEDRRKQFLIALEAKKIRVSDINIDTITDDKKELAIIKEAYNTVQGKLNGNSLLMFSGTRAEYETGIIVKRRNSFEFRKKVRCGCLYTGDIKLGVRLIKDLKNRLNKYLDTIGTIQIPHHGAKRNWNTKILEPQMKSAIISYGTRNRYGHPTLDITNEIEPKVPYTYHVTEESSSKCIQYIHRFGNQENDVVHCINDLKKSTSDCEEKKFEFIMTLLKSPDIENVNFGIKLILTYGLPPVLLEKIPLERLVENPCYYVFHFLKE